MTLTFWIIRILTACLYQANSSLIVTPVDTEAKVNQSTFLNCTTSFKQQDVAWYHYQAGNPYRRNDVYDAGRMGRNYQQRFRIDGDRMEGVFNLVIYPVRLEDAGKYECQDEEGIGVKSSAQLIVLEEDLECLSDADPDGIIGPNVCGIEPDTVKMSCGVRYTGNISPNLEWTIHHPEMKIKSPDSNCKSSGNVISCNLTVTADLQMNGTIFVCRTSRMKSSQIECSLNDFNIIYVLGKNQSEVKKVGEEVTCSAISSQPCQFRWNFFHGAETVIVSNTETLTPDLAGWYKCEATCQMGPKACTVVPLVIHAYDTIPVPEPQSDNYFGIIIVVLASVLGVCFIAILILSICLLRKSRRKESRKLNEMDKRIRASHQSLTETLMPQIADMVEMETLIRKRNDLQTRVDQLESRHENDIKINEKLKAQLQQEEKKTRSLEVALKDEREAWNAERQTLLEQIRHQERMQSENHQDKVEMEMLIRKGNDLQTHVDQLENRHDNDIKTTEKFRDLLQQEINEKQNLELAHKEEREGWNAERQKLLEQIRDLEMIQSETQQGNFEHNENPVLVKAIQRDATKNTIRGLTVLAGKVYVASRESSEVDVYDSSTLAFSRSLKISELQNPWDIASCCKRKCMYVVDWKDSHNIEIFRIKPNGKIITKWTVGERGGCLSVAEDSNVILAVPGKSCLTEYTSEGELVREIVFPAISRIHQPLHAVKRDNGGYIICHGHGDDNLHRVCIVNDQGNVIKSYGGKKGSLVGQLNVPMYLALNQDGSILISDYSNNRVLLLSSTLDFKKELISRMDGLRFSERICLDYVNGNLIIANNNYISTKGKPKPIDGQVLVFKIRYEIVSTL